MNPAFLCSKADSGLASIRILHTESSLGLGGQELRVLEELVGMKHRGHDIVLAVQPESELAQRAWSMGIPLELVRMGRSRFLALIRKFQQIIHDHAIDVLNTHGSIDSWTASLSGRLSRRKPIVIRTRHKSTPIPRSWRHRLLYRSLPDAIVTTGETVRAHLIQEHGVDSKRIVSIPTGVDVRRFSPEEAKRVRQARKAARAGPIVGTVSFLRDYKGIDHLVMAAHRVLQASPGARFWVIGDGPERGRIERMITDLNLQDRVELQGYREDIPELLAQMDVFVLASIGAEGIPQALSQALAMERPIVATAVGGIPEIVEHGVTGLLVAPKDSDGLAQAILSLLHDPLLGEKLGRAGRQRIEREYSLTHMLDKTEGLYYRLLAERRGRSGQCSA